MIPLFSEFELINMFDNDTDDNQYSSMKIPDIMRTDISEINGQVLMEIELPGYARDSVTAELVDGYLTIKAMKIQQIESPYEKRNYLLRERNISSCKRSYYVGNKVKKEDIQAAMKDGVLRVLIDANGSSIEDMRRKIDIK